MGRVEGLPVRQGGLILSRSDYNTLLIGGHANTAEGKLYSVKVARDDQQSIVSFGRARYYADAPFNDGGLCYAPGGILLCAQWPVNNLGQLKPGRRVPAKTIDLGRQDRDNSLASLNFFKPTGNLKLLNWQSGRWFDATPVRLDDDTYRLDNVTVVTTLPGGPEGFVYVPKVSPRFDKPSVLVAEWSAGNIAAYEITPEGDPIVATRRVFIANLEGAEGGMIDPLTGDYLFTTFGGGDRIIRVDGLTIPFDHDYSLYPYPEPRLPKCEKVIFINTRDHPTSRG